MEVNNNSKNLRQSTKSRLGCSVCLKKKYIDKLARKQKHNYNNNMQLRTNEKTPSVIPRPTFNECYCNYMQQMEKESFSKIVCSKSFKTPNLIDMDENWFNEIKEFRRDNWFDCHSDVFVDSKSVKPLCKHILLLVVNTNCCISFYDKYNLLTSYILYLINGS